MNEGKSLELGEADYSLIEGQDLALFDVDLSENSCVNLLDSPFRLTSCKPVHHARSVYV